MASAPNRALTSVLLCALAAWGCGEAPRSPLVLLFELDGATPGVIDELRSEGRLPNLDRLIRSGTSGPLESLAARRLLHESTRRRFASPIVWTTVATGQVPENHGIRDFVLPVPGTTSVWMGSDSEPGRAVLTLPELPADEDLRLELRLHSHPRNGEQDVRLSWNGRALDTIRVPVEWKEFSVPVPRELLRPVRNRLELVFSRQSRPDASGPSDDARPLACELAALRVRDVRGAVVSSFDPVEQRFSLGRGFHHPRARLTEVQSVHWRARPIWSLLGEWGHSVGILGHWGTWPAYPVNGYLVSSRAGIRDQRAGSERLTWPPELIAELEPLAPYADEMDEAFDQLHVSECEPPFVDQKSVLKKILLQDEFYFRIASKLWDSASEGLHTVYFRSIDVASHVALHFRHGAPVPESCSERVRGIVDAIYVQIDDWIGSLLERAPRHANVVIVSDHGMRPVRAGGGHAPEGIFVAAGENVEQGHVVHRASVLDVAPTILHLFGAPVPKEMDGHPLVQIFEADWLAAHPPRYEDIDTSWSLDGEAIPDASEEALEELRALGYIQ